MTAQTSTLNEAAAALRAGKVVLCASDTVYGLAVSPEHPDASNEVYRLKGRSHGRPLPVMVSEPDDLYGLGVLVSPAATRLLDSSLVPGPLTIAFGFDSGASRPWWLDGRVEVAVRIPAASPVRDLVVACGPLLVTSANHTDQPTRSQVTEILDSLDGAPGVIVDSGPCREVPSTLVNCNLDPPVVERVGVVHEADVWRIIGG